MLRPLQRLQCNNGAALVAAVSLQGMLHLLMPECQHTWILLAGSMLLQVYITLA